MENKIPQASKNLILNFRYDDILDYNFKVEPSKYYLAINQEFPNIVTFEGPINAKKFLDWLIETYQLSSDHVWKYNRFSREDNKLGLESFLVTIKNDFMIFYDHEDEECVKILSSDKVEESLLFQINDFIRQCPENIATESKIFLLYESHGHLSLRDFEVKKNNIDVDLNYNDDFSEVHHTIIDRLNKAQDKGLVLLHGVPGTGKTSYIRYLTSQINKKMIYIPPDFAHKIASPDFLPLLISNSNSVLIIEDAENIIEARESGRNASISNLLNIADGLLADCLSIQVLCTFNTNISRVDAALLRKGRLIASYEFRELTQAKAQKLSNSLGFKSKITKATTLTDIYNQNELNFENGKSPKIGF